jgi:hypothetical protein
MVTREYLFGLIYDLSSFSSIIPVSVALFRINYFKKTIYPIVVLVIIAFLVEVICVVHSLSGLNNFYIFRIYTVFEFTLLSAFYILFFRMYINPLIFKLLILFFILVALVDYKINGFTNIDNISSSVSCIILTCYSLFLFYFLLKYLLIENLLSSQIFWVNTAVLFYFSGNLFLFAFSDLLVKKDDESYSLFWATIHSFFNISYNVLLAVALWKTKTK